MHKSHADLRKSCWHLY